jgi:hypothetical protein
MCREVNMTAATTAEANAALIKGTYEAFARVMLLRLSPLSLRIFFGMCRDEGHCREIIGDMLKWVASFKNS